MEYLQTPISDFHNYHPREDEKEKASNGYLMSVITIMVGVPLPIINLFATGIFFLAFRKSTPFVRWHCTQALLSQLTVFVMNSFAFGWTMSIIFGSETITDLYIGYMLTSFTFNVYEVIVNMIAAINVRKGRHVSWWFWGTLTNIIMAGKTKPLPI